jgi:N-ethylmaleimide reductase
VSLVITEGTQPSAVEQGLCNTPGLYTDAQQNAWAAVADGVHARGAASRSK